MTACICVLDAMHYVLAYLSTAECIKHRRVSKTSRDFIDTQYLSSLETIGVNARWMTGVCVCVCAPLAHGRRHRQGSEVAVGQEQPDNVDVEPL
jgi:hypothetical protein